MESSSSYYSSSTGAESELSAGAALGILVFYFALLAFALVTMWRVFKKAGQPGWAALVPIYNTYVMLEIAGRPGWWLLLLFIPFVNIVVLFIINIDIAKAFGKSSAFGVVGLTLFSIIGYAMLAFGNATYQGAAPMNLAAATGSGATPAPTPNPAPAAVTTPAPNAAPESPNTPPAPPQA